MAYDENDPVQVAKVKTHLQTDPKSQGFADMLAAGEWGSLTIAVNSVPDAPYSVARGVVSKDEVFYTLDVDQDDAELGLSTAERRSMWGWLMGLDSIDPNSPAVAKIINKCYPQGQGTGNTRGALMALQTKDGTWPESEFGEGTTITKQQLHAAWDS
jgi:hypothetical protein